MTRTLLNLLLLTCILGLFGGCAPKPSAVPQMPSAPRPNVPVLASMLEPILPIPQIKQHLRYRLQTLTFRPQAINDSGLVCGALTVSERGLRSPMQYHKGGHLVVFERGVVRDLGKLPGTDLCSANAVNSHGEIVGVMGYAALLGDQGYLDTNHAFLWSKGHLDDLGASGEAQAINDKGQVVGQKDWSHGSDPPGLQHGFLYAGGQMHEIKNPYGPKFSQINDINNNGQILAFAWGPNTAPPGFPDRWYHVLLYRRGIGAEITLPNRYQFADADGNDQYGPKMNDVGQIMINAYVMMQGSVNDHCCVWQNGKLMDLGMLPGGVTMNGVAINKQGEVVGNAHISVVHDKIYQHPFLWRRGSLYDLNDLAPHPGWIMTAATGLNNQGQIVGQGQGGGKQFGFLLTPVTN